MAVPATTHDIELCDDVVTKRFRAMKGAEPEREWRALRLLAEYAPGLAPAPVRADLDGSPPTVTMSRLPGVCLGLEPLTAVAFDAYTDAISRLHHAVPRRVLDRIDPVAWPPATALANVQRMLAQSRPALDDPLVRRAFTEASGWLSSGWGERAAAGPQSPVFGHGDGNLANYLWDGHRVRIVDFEDAGRSDQAFELAASVEHLGSWLDAHVEAAAVIGRFDLPTHGLARVHDYRRLFATYWFLRLQPGLSAHERNPPVTLQKQAERLLALLDTPRSSPLQSNAPVTKHA
jgi:hypothetical protein